MRTLPAGARAQGSGGYGEHAVTRAKLARIVAVHAAHAAVHQRRRAGEPQRAGRGEGAAGQQGAGGQQGQPGQQASGQGQQGQGLAEYALILSIVAEQAIAALHFLGVVIADMMSIIGDDPVVWVDTVTQRTDDEYRNASMLAWNQVLYRVVGEYPTARVFRWYDVVRPEWFRNDGIHYTVEGSAQRARLTAESLVTFFPEIPD